jgi:hypothetical protein
MQVQIGSLADYRALVSQLIPGTLLFDQQGRAQRMRLADPDQRPPRSFPAQATLRVVEEPFRDDDPRDRMRFGNNYLQAGAWVEVIDFQPPSSGGQQGRLVALCDDADSYAELRRFLDEPHGSALSALDGRGQWSVNRISSRRRRRIGHRRAVDKEPSGVEGVEAASGRRFQVLAWSAYGVLIVTGAGNALFMGLAVL